MGITGCRVEWTKAGIRGSGHNGVQVRGKVSGPKLERNMGSQITNSLGLYIIPIPKPML